MKDYDKMLEVIKSAMTKIEEVEQEITELKEQQDLEANEMGKQYESELAKEMAYIEGLNKKLEETLNDK